MKICHHCGCDETAENRVLSGDVFIGRGVEPIQWHLCENCFEIGWVPLVNIRSNVLAYSCRHDSDYFRIIIV